MATETITQTTATTTDLPPFPDDVPTAPLLRLSLKKLIAHDADEVQRFNSACQDIGFFYLDLRDAGDDILELADQLFSLNNEIFDLPLDEKRQYDFVKEKSYFGYKGFGANVVNREGDLDRNEFYNVSKDDILGVGRVWPAPDCITRKRALIAQFMRRSHEVVTLVLTLLNTFLELPPGTLQAKHRLAEASGDQVRFLKAPPQPMDDRKLALGAHTDFGSVTVLFNRLGGLQVLLPGEEDDWRYVRPLPGHAIINLGDSMVKFSNGLLRSNIHRVVSPPGEQGNATRYSLVYFNRPQNEVLMKRLEGSKKIPELGAGEVEEEITSADWITRRALGFRTAVHGDPKGNFDKILGTERVSMRIKA